MNTKRTTKEIIKSDTTERTLTTSDAKINNHYNKIKNEATLNSTNSEKRSASKLNN